ncbi:MAG: hypothetical protein ACYTXA_10165 [Nostoc sp.]
MRNSLTRVCDRINTLWQKSLVIGHYIDDSDRYDHLLLDSNRLRLDASTLLLTLPAINGRGFLVQ